MKRRFDGIAKEIERKCIAEVIARIEEIDGSEVGLISAQDVISIVIENLGSEIYNMGLRDAKKVLQERMSDLETDISLLQQSS